MSNQYCVYLVRRFFCQSNLRIAPTPCDRYIEKRLIDVNKVRKSSEVISLEAKQLGHQLDVNY